MVKFYFRVRLGVFLLSKLFKCSQLPLNLDVVADETALAHTRLQCRSFTEAILDFPGLSIVVIIFAWVLLKSEGNLARLIRVELAFLSN